MYEKATIVLEVMAQPLLEGIPPMRICSFGSNNRIKAADVENRLHFI